MTETIGFPGRARLVADLEASGVEVLTSATARSVVPGSVEVAVGDGSRSLPCDTVIGIEPRVAVDPVADAFAAAGVRVHRVGDCDRLGSLEGATAGALAISLAIA